MYKFFLYLTDKTRTGFDFGLLTRIFLIDLQKAFGTINRDMLKICSQLDFQLSFLTSLKGFFK